MRDSFRQSMAWLHTWAGLVVCWILFLVFMAGSATYYRDEITLWMTPELHAEARHPVSSLDASETAVAVMQKRAAGAGAWYINLPEQRTAYVKVFWTIPPKPVKPGEKPGKLRFENDTFSPATGEKIVGPRATKGGEFFYSLHYDLYNLPPLAGRWIVGICAMIMLVALISGVITHKRIFKDFFTFRRQKGQRSWLDAHNVTGVLALPFYLMITYTGLVTMLFMYMPWGSQTVYRGARDTMISEVFLQPAQGRKPAGINAPLVPIRPLLEQAIAHWGPGSAVGKIIVTHPNDANSTVLISREAGRNMGTLQPAILFNGATGAQMQTVGDDMLPAGATRSVMYSLHQGRFAGPLLRALFFLCGLAGCAMVATGALLWAVKTRQKRAARIASGHCSGFGFGLRLVEALNLGVIAGLPIAFAVYFWGNRLLPVVMDKRPEWEIRGFFIAWAVALILAQLSPTRRMWRWQLSAGAGLLAGIPAVNVFTTQSHLGITLFMGKGPASVAGFDLMMLALGLLLAYAAWKLRGPGKPLKISAPAKAPHTAGHGHDQHRGTAPEAA